MFWPLFLTCKVFPWVLFHYLGDKDVYCVIKWMEGLGLSNRDNGQGSVSPYWVGAACGGGSPSKSHSALIHVKSWPSMTLNSWTKLLFWDQNFWPGVVLTPTGDSWQCPETFSMVTTRGRGATGTQWVEIRDAAKHPTRYRTAFHIKDLSSSNCQCPGWETYSILTTVSNDNTGMLPV